MNVGIIGCGVIGKKRSENLGNNTLKAVADIDLEKAYELAIDNTGVKVFSDYKELLKEDVDIVIVSTINNLLSPIALDAIKSGKHVLVEKPAGIHLDQFDALISEAKANSLKVKIGYNIRYHPSFLLASQLIRENVIGELFMIRGRYGHGGRKGYDKEWRANPEVSGGGELIDQGVHLIDLSRWLLGDFTKVSGTIHTYFWDMPVEDNVFMTLETEKGQTAFLQASCTEWKNMFSFEIYGKDGKIQIDGLGGSYGTEKLTLYQMTQEMGIPEVFIREFPRPDNSMLIEMEYFTKCIKDNIEPHPNLEDAQAVLKIVDEIYKSNYVK